MRSRLVTHTPGTVYIRLHFILTTLVTIAGLVLSAATAAQAQASNVIYGCVNQNGLVRIVSSGNVCRNNETPV